MKTWKFVITLMMATAMLAGGAIAAPARLSSITTAVNNPVRVAVDSQGSLYVTEASENRIAKFDASGKFVGALNVTYPISVAIDGTGNIYAGLMVSSKKTGLKNVVQIYDPNFNKIGSLGVGEGEFSFPVDIAIDADGRIFVVDKDNHTVGVYDAVSHAKVSSFGGIGNGNGQLTRPTCVAVNDAAGEIYVADAPQVMTANGMTSGARISVFDKNGVFLRSFGQFGVGAGQMTSPEDIAIDQAGLLYVVDSYQGAALIMNAADGSMAGAGALYDSAAPMFNPSGIAITKNSLVYIASKKGAGAGLGNKDRVDVYGLDGYVTMDVTPPAITIVAKQFGGNPAAQTIVIANTGSGTLQWQAAADQPWIALGQATGACGPKSATGLAISADISSLSLGTYTGTVTIDSGLGQKQLVAVTLSVIQPPVLGISSGWLDFAAKSGKAAPSQAVTISADYVNGSLAWSAASNASWLSIAPAAGTLTQAASSNVMTVTVNAAGMSAGKYVGYISVSAPGSVGDGSKITVNLTVASSSKIAVHTNRTDAKFSVSGPATFNGTGADWSVDDAPAGDYTVTYDAVAGCKRPFAQTKTLVENGEADFNATYLSNKELAAKKNIVVAKGPAETNDSLLKLFKNNGAPEAFDLVALTSTYGANVAVGDVDGDGVADIIVGAGDGPHNPATVRVYRADKSLLLEFVPLGSASGGVRVAAADLNGDGKAEIIASAGGANNTAAVAVYTYDTVSGKMVSTGINIAAESSSDAANIAAADLDGNGKPYIVTAPAFGKNAAHIRVWKVDVSQGDGKWAASVVKEIPLAGSFGASIAAADVDGDGNDEIIAGTGSAHNGDSSSVTIIKRDGSQTSFKAFDHHSVNLAAADLDGDGKAEILLGAGRGSSGQDDSLTDGNKGKGVSRMNKNQEGQDKRTAFGGADSEAGTIRVVNGTGSVKFVLRPFGDVKEGVNVAVGDLAL